MLVLLLCAVIVLALVLSGFGGQVARYVSAAVCRVMAAGGLVEGCDQLTKPDQAQPVQDPDVPPRGCVPYMQREYLEETVNIPVRYVDVRTNSRGTLRFIERIGPDGKPTWEVWDFTWGEGGAATPELDKGPVKGQVWGGLQLTNGNIYGGFSSEQEARRFFNDLREHRLGSEVKFGLRTNPVTGGFVWLGSKMPWAGDDIDRFMGGSEPKRKPIAHFMEGGLTGGIKGGLDLNIKKAKFKLPFKGRGWLLDGSRVDSKSGQVTSYYVRRAEAELGLQIDVGSITKSLPKGLREKANNGVADGVDAVLDTIEKRLKGEYGPNFMLDPGNRAKLREQIRINPGIGLNFKRRVRTRWAVTRDAEGNLVRLTQRQDARNILYFRADGKAQEKNGGKNEMTVGGQHILWANRTVTEKNLDYSAKEDRKIIDRYILNRDPNYFTKFIGDDSTNAVERAWQNGAGTMSRMVYDTTGDTTKLEGKGETKRGLGMFEFSRENEQHRLAGAHYYKPGEGWVPWEKCR